MLSLEPGTGDAPLGARASRPLENRWACGGSSIATLRPGAGGTPALPGIRPETFVDPMPLRLEAKPH